MDIGPCLGEPTSVGSFSWTVPPVPAGSPLVPSGSASTRSNRTFGLYDQEIDQQTHDYIDTDDGAWSETQDSRTAVMMQLEIEYGRWWVDPDAGSRIKALLTSEVPADAQSLAVETKRALGVLVAEGIISDLTVTILNEEYGLVELGLTYSDRASGQTVDGVYLPFGGNL